MYKVYVTKKIEKKKDNKKYVVISIIGIASIIAMGAMIIKAFII